MWPFTKRTPTTATPAQPKPPPEPTPLERWAHEIAAAEFPGQADSLDVLYGIREIRGTLRASDGTWLAEVAQDRDTGVMYRIRRETK